MGKNAKKAWRGLSKHKSLSSNAADVTINDYANSAGNVRRLKKPTANAVVREVKQLRGCADDNLCWYEKDIDDFDIEFSDNSEPVWDQTEEQSVSTGSTISRGRRSHRKNKETKSLVEDCGGMQYPLDVWYILSEYIRPEDVATFACICKSALAVVTSVKFWLGLYKRYYDSSITLPERLTPECMERPRSLRACVVRSLYFTYRPFVERLRPTTPLEDGPHRLVNTRCILMWHQKVKNLWNFFFKFRDDSRSSLVPLTPSKRHLPDLLQMLDDVHANPEDGCQILQVSCQNFVSAPVVMGLVLANVTFNVSHEMHHYRLRLTFDTVKYYRPCRTANSNTVIVNLEPVANVRVLDWWHPQYPHFTE